MSIIERSVISLPTSPNPANATKPNFGEMYCLSSD